MAYQSSAEAVLLKSGNDTKPVLYDEDYSPYGVAGLIGNVKEWVEDRVGGGSKALLRGTTSHLGRESFQFRYSAALFLENSNPDQGFRVARSLSDREIKLLRMREQELALLQVETMKSQSNS